VKDFERNMDMLAETDGNGQGRWIVTPRKGMSFIGPRARAKARARERRRRVLIVLLESIVLTALIGLVPPLRAMWLVTGGLLVLLGAFVWMLLSMKPGRSTARPASKPRPEPARPARHRYAADASGRTPRSSWGGLPAIGDEVATIVVRPADEVGVARA
jgi:hypothetical protein